MKGGKHTNDKRNPTKATTDQEPFVEPTRKEKHIARKRGVTFNPLDKVVTYSEDTPVSKMKGPGVKCKKRRTAASSTLYRGMQSNDDGHNFWMQSSRVCFYAAYGTTGVAAVWFAFINFLGDELYHPLDFFSNKMRTRPYWYFLVLAATGGLLSIDMASGYLDELSNTLPELVVCTNLQGFVLVGRMMLSESAGAAMVTMLAHMIITKGLVVIVTVPTAPFMPGAVYSNGYFLLYMFFVFFLKVGAERHARRGPNPFPFSTIRSAIFLNQTLGKN
eukprot:g25406.t1